MPQIVKADPWQVCHAANEIGELVSEAAGLERLTVGPSAQEGRAILSDTERQQFLGLLSTLIIRRARRW